MAEERTGRTRHRDRARDAIDRLEAERRALRMAAEGELRRRVAEFKRQVAAVRPAARRAGTRVRPAWRIVAEGDSWFAYPSVLGTGGGLVSHIQRILGVPILNLAFPGDQVRQMMSLAQRRRLEAILGDPEIECNLLLFSGGGNDIAGDHFCLALLPREGVRSAADALNRPYFDGLLALVEQSYRALVAVRDRRAPSCWILTHAYDFPRPSSVGVCGLGPWLKPSLDYMGWTSPADQFAIVKAALEGLAQVLRRVAGSSRRFVVAETQGTLDPARHWHNEIHPNREGFTRLARRMAAEIPKMTP